MRVYRCDFSLVIAVLARTWFSLKLRALAREIESGERERERRNAHAQVINVATNFDLPRARCYVFIPLERVCEVRRLSTRAQGNVKVYL